jgi:hypothetical protein
MLGKLGEDLVARTVAALSLATALVAIAIAYDLPRSSDPHPLVAHRLGTEIAGEAVFLAEMAALHEEARAVATVAAAAGGDLQLRNHASELASRYTTLLAHLSHLGAQPDDAAWGPQLRTLEGLLPQEVDAAFRSDMLALHLQVVELMAKVDPHSWSAEGIDLANRVEALHREGAAELQRLRSAP